MAFLPLGDWQFWVVTAIAAAGLVAIVRPLLPRRRHGAACRGCAAGRAAARPKRASITIEGR